MTEATAITSFEITYRDDVALSYTPAPAAVMECHSHVLITSDGTWLIDPLDVPGLDALLEGLPPVVGVLVLLDRHLRDSEAIAARYDVDAWVPAGTRTRSARTYDDTVPNTPFEIVTTRDIPGWHERALWWPEERILVCADVIGSAQYFRVGDDALAVHPLLRMVPPSILRRLDPRLVLVGHGPGVDHDAAAALSSALASSRRRSLRLALDAPRRLLRWGASPRNGC